MKTTLAGVTYFYARVVTRDRVIVVYSVKLLWWRDDVMTLYSWPIIIKRGVFVMMMKRIKPMCIRIGVMYWYFNGILLLAWRIESGINIDIIILA